MDDFLMYIGALAFLFVIAFFGCYVVGSVYRFYDWLFVREYIMTSDTIIRVVRWRGIYAKKRFLPPDVVRWSPAGDTQDDGEWWKKS